MGAGSEDAVRADELERMGRNGTYRFLGGVVEHHGHVERRLAHQVERRVDRIAAAPARDLASASGRPCRRSAAPALAISMLSGPSVPRMFSQPGRPWAMSWAIRRRSSRRRVRASVPCGATLLRPGGQDAREQRAARAVRVLVEREVDLARAVSSSSSSSGSIEALVGERLEVREVQRSSRPAGNVDHLGRSPRAGRGPRCARGGRAVRRRRLPPRATATSSSVAGIGAGQVDEPERQHPGARLEAERVPRGASRAAAAAVGVDPTAAEHDVAHRPVAHRRARGTARAGSRRARRGSRPPSTTATSAGPRPSSGRRYD